MNGIQPCSSVSRAPCDRHASRRLRRDRRIGSARERSDRLDGCDGAAPRRAPGRTRTRSRRVQGAEPAPVRTRCRWRIARTAAPSTAARRPRGTCASGRRPTRDRTRRPAGCATCRFRRIVRAPSPGSARARPPACAAVVRAPATSTPPGSSVTFRSPCGHLLVARRPRARRPVGAGDGGRKQSARANDVVMGDSGDHVDVARSASDEPVSFVEVERRVAGAGPDQFVSGREHPLDPGFEDHPTDAMALELRCGRHPAQLDAALGRQVGMVVFSIQVDTPTTTPSSSTPRCSVLGSSSSGKATSRLGVPRRSTSRRSGWVCAAVSSITRWSATLRNVTSQTPCLCHRHRRTSPESRNR